MCRDVAPTVGIMQGRLVAPLDGAIQAFPCNNWDQEFPRAAEAGLAAIEWIYDQAGEQVNPLATDAGIARIRELSRKHGIAIRSCCADWFMANPLVRASDDQRHQRLAHLEWLLERCQVVGVGRIVLPFVDASAIRAPEDRSAVITSLKKALPTAERLKVELHLETSLGPDDFESLLAEVPDSLVKVNYDSGNSASLGYKSDDEFAAYGDRLGSVHIKDRLRGGGTVPLGKGDADLPAVFKGLKKLGYAGEFILQVARGDEGDEVAWARQNRATVEKLWAAA